MADGRRVREKETLIEKEIVQFLATTTTKKHTMKNRRKKKNRVRRNDLRFGDEDAQQMLSCCWLRAALRRGQPTTVQSGHCALANAAYAMHEMYKILTLNRWKDE